MAAGQDSRVVHWCNSWILYGGQTHYRAIYYTLVPGIDTTQSIRPYMTSRDPSRIPRGHVLDTALSALEGLTGHHLSFDE